MKQDIIAVGLYAVLMHQYLKARETEKIMIKHLEDNYQVNEEWSRWDMGDVLGEVIYDDEINVDKFLRLLDNKLVAKK